MEIPWKWTSDEFAEWHYEKQKYLGTWVEVFQKEASGEILVEESYYVRANNPEIMLLSISKGYYILLTSDYSMQFSAQSLSSFYSNAYKTKGFWAKNKGKHFLSCVP